MVAKQSIMVEESKKEIKESEREEMRFSLTGGQGAIPYPILWLYMDFLYCLS